MAKRILVAEDDPASLELVCEILSDAGYEVFPFPDGRTALTKIAEIQPDLVILDIQTPYLDGLSAVRQIRQDPRFKSLPAVALTAYAMRGDREKVLEAGFDGYITKPIDIHAFKEQIDRFLGDAPRPG